MSQKLVTLIMLSLWSGLVLSAPAINSPYPGLGEQPVITIIIDDIGIQHDLSQRALQLPGSLTYAFLPHSQHGRELAEVAHLDNRDIILHLPMQPLGDRRVDEGALTPEQNQQQFLATLREDLQRIPYIRGVNNHMGSLLTQQTRPMQWLMQELAQYDNLFFIDSRTSPNSVGYQQARRQGLSSLRRNVFLDNDIEITAINRQFMKLLDIARRQGSAIAIGHPYPATLTYLENMLPALPLLGIQLLSASELIAHKTRLSKTRQLETPMQTAELKTITLPPRASPTPPNLVP
jgi:polysaccharide deacetylase 2 family uncharacterized protein YibQ